MNRKKISFVVACVGGFVKKHGLSVQEAFKYLFQFRGIEFLRENYKVEHTLDFATILEDLRVSY